MPLQLKKLPSATDTAWSRSLGRAVTCTILPCTPWRLPVYSVPGVWERSGRDHSVLGLWNAQLQPVPHLANSISLELEAALRANLQLQDRVAELEAMGTPHWTESFVVKYLITPAGLGAGALAYCRLRRTPVLVSPYTCLYFCCILFWSFIDCNRAIQRRSRGGPRSCVGHTSPNHMQLRDHLF